jgi:hypothetical protein
MMLDILRFIMWSFNKIINILVQIFNSVDTIWHTILRY